MKRTRVGRSAMALVVAMCLLVVGCAGTMNQSPGQAALVCGAGGAAAGAMIGAAAARNWQGALIGAAAGALAGGLTCFAVAEYRSRQVRNKGGVPTLPQSLARCRCVRTILILRPMLPARP